MDYYCHKSGKRGWRRESSKIKDFHVEWVILSVFGGAALRDETATSIKIGHAFAGCLMNHHRVRPISKRQDCVDTCREQSIVIAVVIDITPPTVVPVPT